MKILITGSSGYQGSKLIPLLLKKKYKVIGIDTQWFGKNLSKNKNLLSIKKNILEINNSDFKNIDAIIHLASIANDPMGDLVQNITWEYSCLGSMKLIELAIKNKVKKFIYASSASVYGLKKEKKVTENLSLKPISTYNKTKMITERLLMSYKDKINLSIIRPATVCGLSPRMRFDVSVNMLAYQAIKNNEMTIFGGQQTRPNIHIDDLLDIYLSFLENKKKFNGIFNAGFENLKIIEIANLVKKKLPNCKINIIKKNIDIRDYRLDSSKLMSLGFKPKKNVSNAIDEIYDYYFKKKNKTNPKNFSISWLKKNHKKFFDVK
jgi:nucleoside-diphosphate-sugar epimerase